MGYLVLSRKYRPQRFEEVVGQEHVTQTLRNALTAGRLAHAILFSGPRGTGKTTIARVLAKCVNCASGSTPTPCNHCRSCREITEGHAVDVFEIDGASNNKVENIRELRENAKYMPAHSPYKIYIIDEVHMLSDSAFNALLKILEEPPSHVMFFFATTEPNKIPITILSRCQRHDLRRIRIDSIIAHLAFVCRQEGIEIGEEGLSLIAREADGSIRDALSLLDQITSGVTGSIPTDLIIDIIGGIDRQTLFEFSEALFRPDPGKIIETIDRLYERGQHMIRLFAELLQHFRNLLLVKMEAGSRALADVPEHEMTLMRHQVKDISLAHLNQVLDMLFKEEATIKLSLQPKLALEMAFMRILQVKPALSLDTLIEKIDLLQKGILPENPLKPELPMEPDPPKIHKTPRPVEPEPEEKSNALSGMEKKPLNPVPDDSPADALPINTDQTTAEAWQTVLDRISKDHPMLAACFTHSSVTAVENHRIIINVKSKPFNISYVKQEESQEILKRLFSEALGRPVQVEIHAEPFSTADPQAKKKREILKKEALNHPLLETAMRIFQGKIIDVKILQETEP